MKTIKNIMNYKKPVFWVAICCVVLCVAIVVCVIAVPTLREKDNNDATVTVGNNSTSTTVEKNTAVNSDTSTTDENNTAANNNTSVSDENNDKNNTVKNNNTSVEDENDDISVSDEYIVWRCMDAGDVWDYECSIELDFKYTKILCECTQGKMLYNGVEDESGFYLYDSAKKVEYKYGEKILWEPKSHGPFNTPPEIKLTVYNGDEIIHTGTIVIDYLKEVFDDDFDESIDRYDWYYSAKMTDSDGMYLQETDIDNYPDILISSSLYSIN